VLPEHCPQKGAVRLFIAITSRCCTPSARAKRNAIRKSWLKTIQTEYSDQITAQFVLSQPAGGDAAILAAADFLKEEAALYGDISFVPGEESYRQLPAKTLHTLHYALSSSCRYSHIVKTDDDVFLRPGKMLDIIFKAERQYEFDIPSPITPHVDGSYSKELKFDGRKVATFENSTKAFASQNDEENNATATALLPVGETPWLSNMYIGKIDSNQTGVFPGWSPNRNSTSKWYLSESDLPDEDCPLGARWTSGWGYMMSRDVAQKAWDAAVKNAMSSSIETRPVWWGRLPWEDVLIATLLQSYGSDTSGENFEENTNSEVVVVSHHPGFKAAWDACDKDTVLKHLDNDAPVLTPGLQAQESSGLWLRKDVVCSSGVFESGDYEGWRSWRNTLPDNIKGGFM
jgi:Galactosyltransferase